jgi:hypothetical protein
MKIKRTVVQYFIYWVEHDSMWKKSPSFLWKSPSSLPKVLLLLPVVPRGRSQVSLSLSSVVSPGGLFSKLCWHPVICYYGCRYLNTLVMNEEKQSMKEKSIFSTNNPWFLSRFHCGFFLLFKISFNCIIDINQFDKKLQGKSKKYI